MNVSAPGLAITEKPGSDRLGTYASIIATIQYKKHNYREV